MQTRHRVISFFVVLLLLFGTAIWIRLSTGVSAAEPSARVELPEKRTEFSRTYRNANGSLTTDISQEQLYYKDASGGLAPIDPALKSDAGGYKVDANSLKVRLGTSPADLVTMSGSTDPSATVTYGPLDAELATMPATKRGERSVAYNSYKAGADLAYEVGPGRLKEKIVLSEAPKDEDFRFALRLENLTPKRQEDGSIALLDKDGMAKIMIERPYMTDALAGRTGAPDEAFTSWDVSMKIESTGSGDYVLIITPDRKWLADPARTWPITIDPTFSIVTGSTQDTYIRSDDPYDDYHFHTVGTVQVGAYSAAKQMRSLVQFGLSSIPAAATVETATLNLTTEPYPVSTVNAPIPTRDRSRPTRTG